MNLTIKTLRRVGVFVLLLGISFGGHFAEPAMGQSQDKAPSNDWPSFLGAGRDGKSAVVGIEKDWSNGKLKTDWEQPIGRGYVIGAIADGSFFQFEANDEVCQLVRRDAATGAEVWKFEYKFDYKDTFGFDSGPRATPVIDDGHVYIYGVAGMLHCLSVDTGDIVWKADVSQQYGVVQNFFGVGSTPIVAGDKLLVMVGGSPEKFQKQTNGRLDTVEPNGSAVVAFDKRTGKEIYRLGDDLASYSSINLYESSGTAMGVAWLRNKAIGFEVETGQEKWSHDYRSRKYETVNATTPVVDKSRIFLCESYGPGSLLLDVADNQPKVIWNDTDRRNRSLATHWNTPILHDGHLYACHGAGPRNCEIRCVEFETGAVKWKQPGFARSSLTFVDGQLVVLDESGKLLLVEATPDAYKLTTEYSDAEGKGLGLKSPCWAAPVVADGRLYVRGKNRLLCLQLK